MTRESASQIASALRLVADSIDEAIAENLGISFEWTILPRPIQTLNLSVRSRKTMARLGITTVEQLCKTTADELLATKNFGVTCLEEVRQKLGAWDLALKDDPVRK